VRRYLRAKALRQIARHSCNYDLTSKCNLFCEGCFYFEGHDYKRAKEQVDVAQWRDFFRRQAEEGITFANIAGAEPALVPRRLEAAYSFLPRGTIFTNGTIKIDRAIGYTIVISVWGDEKTTSEFRGGDVFWKALKTYSGDSRGRVLFLVHARNLHQVPAVTRTVVDHGLPISFNYFSPTESYRDKIAAGHSNDKRFFRLSSKLDNFMLSEQTLGRVRDVIDEMVDHYPGKVIHSRAFNQLLTKPGSIYDIDAATGIARDCNGRNFRWHQAYRADLQPSDAKCCTPNVSCQSCRLNAVALISLVFQQSRFLKSLDGFRDWLDICEQWGRAHLLDSDPVWEEASETVKLPESRSLHVREVPSGPTGRGTRFSAAPYD
jgi:hypothetical protein